MTKGYCVKCGEKVEIQNEKKKTFKNGRKGVQGNCPECDTKVTAFTG